MTADLLCYIRPYNVHTKSILSLIKKYQPRQLKLMNYWSETVFTYKVYVTLTFEPENNRGYLLANTNASVKFEGKVPMS
jgi:hypothetical protein